MAVPFTRIDNAAAGHAARRAALRSQRQTPGAYMRESRERAAVSRRSCAEKICGHPGEYESAVADIEALEDDCPGDYAQLVRALHSHRAFRFDINVFFGLATGTAAPALGEIAA